MDRRTFLLLATGAAAAGSACSRRAGTSDSAGPDRTVGIAAAANLVYALEELNRAFRAIAPDVTLKSTVGASGSLFAQLQHGAPFDVFLSADTEFPAKTVATGLADPESLRVFATGRLVLWTTRPDVDLADVRQALTNPRVQKLAIAQPQTAPYGRAGLAVLQQLGIAAAANRKLVYGESIAQAAQFVETGNADVGFVALSLVRSGRLAGKGRWIEVPPTLFAGVPLDHAVVLTTAGARNPSARRYLEFLSSQPAKDVLQRFGYSVP